MGIVAPLGSAAAGASVNVVMGVSILCFVVLIATGLYLADRSPNLTRLFVVVGLVLIFGVISLHVYRDMSLRGGAAEGGAPLNPPRVLISVWEDQPSLELGENGRLVRLDGNGIRDIHERYLAPVEVRASSRSNPTKMLNIPGQFNEFSSGDTIVLEVCGLKYVKNTYLSDDKRYSDQIVWDIPVKSANRKGCSI